MGGLSAGYALFGRLTRRLVERARTRGEPPRLLYTYALVEASIGLYALLFPWTFGLAQKLSLLGPTGTGTAFAFDIALSALLLGLPTLLMGRLGNSVVFPAFSRALDAGTNFSDAYDRTMRPLLACCSIAFTERSPSNRRRRRSSRRFPGWAPGQPSPCWPGSQ